MLRPPQITSILILFLIHSTINYAAIVPQCTNTQVWAKGRELLSALKGQIVLVAFPSRNEESLQKLSELASHHPSVRIVTLLDKESTRKEDTMKMEEKHRRLILDRDDYDVKRRLGMNTGDAALFDRCGRLSRSLSLSSHRDLHHSLKNAAHHANCGWCLYGTNNEKMDAYLQAQKKKEEKISHSNRQSLNQQSSYQLPRPTQQFTHSTMNHQSQQPRYPQYEQGQQSPQSSSSSFNPFLPRENIQRIRPEEYRQNGMNNNLQIQGGSVPPSQMEERPEEEKKTFQGGINAEYDDDYDFGEETTTPPKKNENIDIRRPTFNEETNGEVDRPFQSKGTSKNSKNLFSTPTSSSPSSTSSRRHSTSSLPSSSSSLFSRTPTTPSTTTSSSKFEDYSDYDDYGAMKILGMEQAQPLQTIVQPPRGSHSVSSRGLNDEEDLVDEEDEEVPCRAITDDICYHQKKSGRRLSKCCRKGVYMTDFCIPGKCSNTTMQACCMQKYLQARFQCCENSDMEGTTATDSFSKCCHSMFVGEDDCCPSSIASEYWQSVHDICLPNIQVDLSNIKLEVRLTDGIRVLDFSETDKWQYECRYGTTRAQFVYVP